jgi:hypothetical protein
MRHCRLFRSDTRWASLLPAVIVVAVLTASVTVKAQTARGQDATGASSQEMSVQEKQGFGCLYAGALGVLAAYVYSDIIAVAVSGMLNPGLLVPVLASGFVVACGVGTQATPAILRMFSRS